MLWIAVARTTIAGEMAPTPLPLWHRPELAPTPQGDSWVLSVRRRFALRGMALRINGPDCAHGEPDPASLAPLSVTLLYTCPTQKLLARGLLTAAVVRQF